MHSNQTGFFQQRRRTPGPTRAMIASDDWRFSLALIVDMVHWG